MKYAILFTFFLGSFAFSAERITTSSFQSVLDIVMKKKTEFGAASVLVVYDFDNTLMAMNADAGSDQWYNWQMSALKSEKAAVADLEAGAVTKKNTKNSRQTSKESKESWVSDQSELFDLHYKLFALVDMHPVEKSIPSIVKEIQNSGIKSIILTARGSVYRNDIEIELGRMDLSFKESAIGPEGGYASTFKPDNIERPRSISYQDGIIMGSGQNKGLLLKHILKKTNSSFKAIVFVDDTLKNIENVEKEYAEDSQMFVIHYTHEQGRVDRFQKDKKRALKEWQLLKPVLKYFRDHAITE